MSSNDTELFKTWGQTLSQARASQGRDSGTLARELMLSLAQIKGIENGETRAFHARSYYLRGVQRYAEYLGIELEPSVASIMGPNDALAQRARTPQRAAGIAQRQNTPINAMALPDGRTHGSKSGRWLLLILLALGGAGVYMAMNDGWPQRAVQPLQAHSGTPNNAPVESTLEAAATLMEAAPLAEQALVNQIDPSKTSPSLASVTHSTEPARAEISGMVASPTTQFEPSSSTATIAVTPPRSNDSPEVPTTLSTQTPLAPTSGNETVMAAANPVSSHVTASPLAANTGSIAASTALPVSPSASTSEAPSPTATPTLTPENTSVVPDVSNADIVLSFSEACWVEWRLNDGQTQQRIYQPGEELRLPVNQVQRLVLGNARSIQAQALGKPLDLSRFIRGAGTVARIDGSVLMQAIR